jgi:hypothetical protein
VYAVGIGRGGGREERGEGGEIASSMVTGTLQAAGRRPQQHTVNFMCVQALHLQSWSPPPQKLA